MSASKIKDELKQRWRDDPVIALCFSIVDFVARLPADQSQMLTFRTLSKAVGKVVIDDDLLRAVTILVSSRVCALDAHALLVDDDESEHEIEPEDLSYARETGKLVHPLTGLIINDYEARVIPFFAPSAKFLEVD